MSFDNQGTETVSSQLYHYPEMSKMGPVVQEEKPSRPVHLQRTYGSLAQKTLPAREPLHVMTLIGCIVGPLLIFIFEMIVQTMQWRHEHQLSRAPTRATVQFNPSPTKCLSLAAFIIICIGACQPSFENSTKGRLWQFLLFSGLLAWTLGLGFGEYNWMEHYNPYWTVNDLATYPNVDPNSNMRDGPWTEFEVGYHDLRGQQFIDAGVIEFLPGSHVNLSLSYGFKNKDVYCVAPIVFGDQASQNETSWKGYNDGNRRGFGSRNYNFWAVGTNCCSGHGPDYHCGEYMNPGVHKGLRLMKPKDRNYFRLAVKEAEAAYNIQADFPIFVYLMSSPSEEIKSYKDDGDKMFLLFALGFGVFQMITTWLAASFYI